MAKGHDDFSCNPGRWSMEKLIRERRHGMPAVTAEWDRRIGHVVKRQRLFAIIDGYNDDEKRHAVRMQAIRGKLVEFGAERITSLPDHLLGEFLVWLVCEAP